MCKASDLQLHGRARKQLSVQHQDGAQGAKADHEPSEHKRHQDGAQAAKADRVPSEHKRQAASDHQPVNLTDVSREQANLVPAIIQHLQLIVTTNDRALKAGDIEDGVPSSFHAVCDPGIPVDYYVKRLAKYGGASPAAFTVALIYMDRLFDAVPTLVLSSLSFHRIVLATVMLANKFLDDIHHRNSHWAEVGGVTLKELNWIEAESLRTLGWQCNVTVDQYARY